MWGRLAFGSGGHTLNYALADENTYEQGFVSLSAVPAVPTGEYVDPLTGAAYQTYESGMPPPDGDWVDMTQGNGKNRALNTLQGGWSNNSTRPEKREVLEGDFHMHGDRTINTYGGFYQQVEQRVAEDAERGMRFNRNDEQPDGLEGQIMEGGQASNTVGYYGQQKIRLPPRLQHTNRGKQDEGSVFRGGMQPGGVVADGAQKVAQTFTHFPQEVPMQGRMGGPAGDNMEGAHGQAARGQMTVQHTSRGLEVHAHLHKPNTGGGHGQRAVGEVAPGHTTRGMDIHDNLLKANHAPAKAMRLRENPTVPTKVGSHANRVYNTSHGGVYATAARPALVPQHAARDALPSVAGMGTLHGDYGMQNHARSMHHTQRGSTSLLKKLYGAFDNMSGGGGVGMASRSSVGSLNRTKQYERPGEVPSMSLGGDTNMERMPNDFYIVNTKRRYRPENPTRVQVDTQSFDPARIWPIVRGPESRELGSRAIGNVNFPRETGSGMRSFVELQPAPCPITF